MVKELFFYKSSTGKVPFEEWLDKVSDLRARVKIEQRLDRLMKGNYGDHSPLRKGVTELKIDYGPGYRIYFGEIENGSIVILLLGGAKKKQSKDIELAIEYWEDYKRRY